MAYQQLSTEERYMIAAMRTSKHSAAAIARKLKRHRSTIYREVARNAYTYDRAYRPLHAAKKTNGRRCRSPRNQRYTPRHFAVIERLLRVDFSPEKIVGRLRQEGVRVMSHETIHLHIWCGQGAWRQSLAASARRPHTQAQALSDRDIVSVISDVP